MTRSDTCPHCGNSIPLSEVRCPHCAQPGSFPNVRVARDPIERDALEKRYQNAVANAVSRGCGDVLEDFENIIGKTQAVINRRLGVVQRLASSDNEVYATYYQLSESGIQIPSGDKWDLLRRLADDAILPGYKEDIRFGALSLDGHGIYYYGECSIVLRDNMIAHRASVFEENSVMFLKHHDIKCSDVDNLPKGYRGIWDERGKGCVAKLADKISAGTNSNEYALLLLRNGRIPEEDIFVEVHIWGPITRRTFEKVILKQPKRKGAPRVILKALNKTLSEANVGLEVV